MRFACQPDEEQRAIGAILGALDDKIDLNRRMNETLEAMARAIFKDWFVDFGPTRAKMKAARPTSRPEIWALFPDRLDNEGKPEGWEWGHLLAYWFEFNPESWSRPDPSHTPSNMWTFRARSGETIETTEQSTNERTPQAERREFYGLMTPSSAR